MAWLWVALGSTLVFFHRAVFSRDVFLERDVLRVVYPLKAFWAERVAAGELPAWFPHDGLGQPFVSMVISAAFHPTNLLFLALPLAEAQKLCTLGCYPVAFLGVVVWLRAYRLSSFSVAVAAIAFAFNGYMVGITNNVLYLMAAATLPWVLGASDWFLSRPSLLRALAPATALALVLFAGDSQSFAIACGLTLLIPLTRPEYRARPVLNLGLAGSTVVLGALLAAPVLLPAARLLAGITAGDRPIEVALTWSVHPLQAVELVLGPLFAGTPDSPVTATIDQDLLKLGKSAPWVESLHLGLPTLIFAAVALFAHRRKLQAQLAAGLALALLLLVLGKHTGLYELLFDLVPLWRPFRYPVKLVPLLVLVLAAGAAFGFERVTARSEIRRRTSLGLLAAGVLCLALFAIDARTQALSRTAIASVWSRGPADAAVERIGAAFQLGAAQTAIVCILIAVALLGLQQRALGSGLAVLAVAVHLFVANEPHYQVAMPEILAVVPPFVEQIRTREGPAALGRYRVVDVLGPQHLPENDQLSWSERLALSGLHSLTSNVQQLYGLEGANNILPATSARYAALCKQKDLWLWRYAGLFNTRYVSIPTEQYRALGGDPAEVVGTDVPYRLSLLEKRDVRPRAYLARMTCVADGPAALRALSAPAALAPDEAIVECGKDERAGPPINSPGIVTITSYAPERVTLEATVRSPSVLVLNDAYFDGWTARVDGAPAPILPANYAVRAVRLEPGQHTVVFEYQTPGLAAGLLLGLLSALGALVGGLALHLRSPKRPLPL